jgi:hypothetical protein
MKFKLRILNRFGSPEPLDSPDEIEVVFPGENAAVRKFMTRGAVEVLSSERGEIAVELSQMDIECMSVGRNQNFAVLVSAGVKTVEAIFTRTLHVDTILVDGTERKVIAR